MFLHSYSEVIRRKPEKPTPNLETSQTFTCDVCGKHDWLTENDLFYHRKRSHLEVIHSQMVRETHRFCTICMKLQPNAEELIKHIKTHHLLSSPTARRVEREIFICNYCSHVFFNKGMMQTHILNYHTLKHTSKYKKFPCPKCKKHYRVKAIWLHLQNHDIPSVSICEICFTNFSTFDDLQKHSKLHLPHFKCELCQYQTMKDVHFEKHLDQHRRAGYKTVPCKKLVSQAFCKSKGAKMLNYSSPHSLKGMQLPPSVAICVLCREICMTEAEMTEHILRDHLHTAAPPQHHVCTCGAEFVHRVMLKHHMFKEKGTHRDVNDAAPAVHDETKTVEMNFSKVDIPFNTMEVETTDLDVQTTVLDTQTTVLDDQTIFLDAQTTVSDAQATVLNASTTVLDTPTTVLDTPTTVLDTPTTVLDAQITVLDAQTTVLNAPTPVLDAQTKALDAEPTSLETIALSEQTLVIQTPTEDIDTSGQKYIVIEQNDDGELTYILAIAGDEITEEAAEI